MGFNSINKNDKIDEAYGKMHGKMNKAHEKIYGKEGDIISKIAAEAGAPGAKLMSLTKPLESIFPKKDVDFALSPVPHFRIKYKGKTIILVNKKYADDADEVVNNIAIGYEGKI